MKEILDIIQRLDGVKAFNLVREVSSILSKNGAFTEDRELFSLIEEMIKAKQLVEVEYSSDLFDVRSFLLPAKTRVNVRGNEKEPHRI